jgi:voltage-gated sodium channel
LLKDPRTERVILTLIINAIILGLETSPSAMAALGPVLIAIDRIVLTIFVLELAARLVVHRLSFLRDPWSVFDLAVVGIALVPATGALSVLRALRSCGCCA